MPRNDDVVPEGVVLRDFEDFDTLRNNVFDTAKTALTKKFPQNYGGYRLEVEDIGYDSDKAYSLKDQKDALMKNRYLARSLKGTLKLVDEKTGKVMEKGRTTLMRVPYLTERGTTIHNGNEYTTLNQAVLLPGVYTRRRATGEIESHFNPRTGTGPAYRIQLEPKTQLFKLASGQASFRLYSLLHDLGMADEQIEKSWGPELLEANRKKYDTRVFEKAYQKLVRYPQADASREDKQKALIEALQGQRFDRGVIEHTLPHMFNAKVASAWQQQQQGGNQTLQGQPVTQTGEQYVKWQQAQQKQQQKLIEQQQKMVDEQMAHQVDMQGMIMQLPPDGPDVRKLQKSQLQNILKLKKLRQSLQTELESDRMKWDSEDQMQQMQEEFDSAHGEEERGRRDQAHQQKLQGMEQQKAEQQEEEQRKQEIELHTPQKPQQQQDPMMEALHPQESESTGENKTYYHGSPNADITELTEGSYVSPDRDTASLMGRYHEDTGKQWSDEDLAEPHMFGQQPKWKPGREPMGKPSVYEMRTGDSNLDIMDNPYEHKTLKSSPVSLSAELDPNTMAQAEGLGKIAALVGGSAGTVVSEEAKAKASVLSRLLEAKRLSDGRQYKQKHNIMRGLVKEHKLDFYVDSEENGILGITHLPTGFRMHLPDHVLYDIDLQNDLAQNQYNEPDDAVKAASKSEVRVLPSGQMIDIDKLYSEVGDNDAVELDINQLRGLRTRSKRHRFSWKRYNKADDSRPGLVDKNGFIIDGRHRAFKLLDGGSKTIKMIPVDDETIGRAYVDGGTQDYSIGVKVEK